MGAIRIVRSKSDENLYENETIHGKDLLLVASGVVVAAVSRGGILPAFAATQITGAGATFPYPFFSKAFYEYSQKTPCDRKLPVDREWRRHPAVHR